MAYLDENFLLHSETARRLFHEVAATQPIIDYHNHLPPDQIASNHRWDNLSDLWLGHDHYKWRLLRANGIDEDRITGSASPRDKFQAFAETIPYTLRNPMHHWVHMELQRYFGIHTLLTPDTADEIWEQTREILAGPDFTARGLLKKFDVRVVGTTDDPADSLEHHEAIIASGLPQKSSPPSARTKPSKWTAPTSSTHGWGDWKKPPASPSPTSPISSQPFRNATGTSMPQAHAFPTTASTAAPR